MILDQMRRAISRNPWTSMRTMTKKNKIEWKTSGSSHSSQPDGIRPGREAPVRGVQARPCGRGVPADPGDLIVKGIMRLPLLSAVYYQEADGALVYLLLEPTDGQVEALRLALEKNLEVHFVDRDTRDTRSTARPCLIPMRFEESVISSIARLSGDDQEETIPPQDMLARKPWPIIFRNSARRRQNSFRLRFVPPARASAQPGAATDRGDRPKAPRGSRPGAPS